MNVRSWLRRVPQPAKIRLDRKKEIRVGEGKNKWRDVLEIIESEQPGVLEALNAEGEVIRLTELQEGGEREETKDAAKLPPELAMLPALAELLLSAYVKGAEQHAKAYELAFHENTKLVTALSQQTRNLQHSLDAQLEARLQQAADGGEGAVSDLMSGPLAPLIQTMLMRHLPAHEDKSTNGKAKGK